MPAKENPCIGHSVYKVMRLRNSYFINRKEIESTYCIFHFKLQVWEISSKKTVFDTEVDDITWTSWHSSTNALLAGTQDGTIWLWLIPHGHTKSLQSFGEATTTGKFLSDGKRIIAG